MQRLLLKSLIDWKNSPNRKPLIIKGVRQCGKTYLLKEFGKDNYQDVAYFNFEGNTALQARFEKDLDVNRIVVELGLLQNKVIKPKETLIIGSQKTPQK
jgi:predicted AAA+ superfamily ATPase